MKKIIAAALALVLVFGLIACKKTDNGDNGNGQTGGKAKIGMAVVTRVSGIDATADADGNAQTDSTIAAVLLNADGTIRDCIIDVASSKVTFTAEGKILNAADEFATKRELGDAYNMKGRSDIGLEWYEQAENFSEYVIGKTGAEVKGIAVTEGGVPEDEALLAGATIDVGDFIEAVSAACDSAKDLGAADTDKLGLAVFTSAEDSMDASIDADGVCSVYSTYSAVSIDGDSKVTSGVMDASQSKINVNMEGAITTDLSSIKVLTKNVLKEDYNMKDRSEIGLEWYEQAEGFAAYITGKTAGEIGGISISEAGAATDEALLATTTVTIGELVQAAKMAAEDAQSR